MEWQKNVRQFDVNLTDVCATDETSQFAITSKLKGTCFGVLFKLWVSLFQRCSLKGLPLVKLNTSVLVIILCRFTTLTTATH